MMAFEPLQAWGGGGLKNCFWSGNRTVARIETSCQRFLENLSKPLQF